MPGFKTYEDIIAAMKPQVREPTEEEKRRQLLEQFLGSLRPVEHTPTKNPQHKEEEERPVIERPDAEWNF